MNRPSIDDPNEDIAAVGVMAQAEDWDLFRSS